MAGRAFTRLHYLQKFTVILLFCSLMPVAVTHRVMAGCELQESDASGFTRDGDILIGGIFPVHDDTDQQDITFREQPLPVTCETFGIQNYQWVQAMVFAIEEINNNSNLLPNITLGFQIYDSCTVLQRALRGALWILSGQDEPVPNYWCRTGLPPAAIIGDAGSTRSVALARILGLYRYPQISYFSTSSLLSDRNQFPSFFRTIPSDDFQSRGLAELVMQFGWTWVGLLAADDDYGQRGIQLVQQELVKAGACVAFFETIFPSQAAKSSFHITQVIKNSTARAIIIFSSSAYLTPLLDEMVRENVTGKIWIASEAWSTSSLLSIRKYSEILVGTIGFAIHNGEMVAFQKYFSELHPSTASGDIFMRRFWEEIFGCQWLHQEKSLRTKDNEIKACTGDEKLSSLSFGLPMDFRITHNVYSAVYATALALQTLRACIQSEGPFLQETCINISDFHPWQLLRFIKKVHLRREGPENFFDKYGNPPAQYDMVNWQGDPDGIIRHVKVGSYDSSSHPGKTLIINASSVQWASGIKEVPLSVCSPSCSTGFRKASRPGKPLCCFQCVPCLLAEISNQTDSIECFKCPWVQWPNDKRDGCVPKITEFLAYNETFGVILAATSIFSSMVPIVILGLFIRYRNTPIIKANNSNLSYLLLVSLTFCFLCSLAFIGYPTSGKCLIRQIAFGIAFALCVSCILAKTITVVIAFSATKPNSELRRWVGPHLSYMIISISTFFQVLLCIFWLVLAPPFPEYNAHTQPGMITVECNEGSSMAFWCMLGYLGLLGTISFIVAFLARKLPGSFNEAKYITFSMLAFLSVWLSFVPAYLSTKGKYMVAMEIFAILSSSLALVFCLFFPKCYIILIKPKRNTKEYLMR